MSESIQKCVSKMLCAPFCSPLLDNIQVIRSVKFQVINLAAGPRVLKN